MDYDRTPRPDVFRAGERDTGQRSRLPSEQRDFAPTPGGWAGIIVVAVFLAWLMWQQGGEDAGLGWLVASVVLGYAIATMGWTAIRRHLDRREDQRYES